MSKKNPLIDALEALPKVRATAAFEKSLPADKREAFEEAMKWWREREPRDRPKIADFVKVLKSIAGVSISATTIRRIINDAR